jgi:polygalacturonase
MKQRRILNSLVLCFQMLLPLSLLIATEEKPGQPHFNIMDYGAVGDAETLNTGSIQKAIDACTANGGGTVFVPAGEFVSAPLELKSNVRLFLSNGAVLRACPDSSAYGVPEPLPRFIYARNSENIVICGPGTIHGNGIRFGGPGRFRPYPILLQYCRNVQLKDLTIKDSAIWTIKMQACEYVTIDGVTILNNLKRVNNTDGIDPDGCRHVRIANCHIESGDDAIVIKSTNQLGDSYPAENIVVTNCTIVTRKTALKCGTETWNNIRNVIFSNCTIQQSSRGIGLWMRDGGIMENIMFSNINMDLMNVDGESMTGEPIRIVLQKRNPDSKLGTIRNIVFDNLIINAPFRGYLQGHAEQDIDGVTIRDVRWRVTTGLKMQDDPAPGYVGHSNMTRRNQTAIDALFCSNIRNLNLENISIAWTGSDQSSWRHAVYCSDAENVHIEGLKARQGIAGSTDAAVYLRQVQGALIRNCYAPEQTSTFLRLEGEDTGDILLKSNVLNNAGTDVDVAGNVDRSRISFE